MIIRKNLIAFICFVAVMSMSSCYHTHEDEWENMGIPKTTNELIYYYTMTHTLQYADILLLTYQLKEYLRQTNEEARDSVNMLYFSNVRIDEQKDVLSGKPYHELTTYWPIQAQYRMTVFEQADGITNIEAMSQTALRETAHNLTVEVLDPERWKITVNFSLPKENCLISQAFSVKSDKEKETVFIAEWHDTRQDGLSFQLSGKGAMESVAEPRLYISYDIEKAFTIYFKSDSPLYPTRDLYETYGMLLQDDYHLAYPSGGRIKMVVFDPISGKTETYVRDNLYYESEIK